MFKSAIKIWRFIDDRTVFLAFGVNCALKRGRPQARQLFIFSIAYLPLLTAMMVLDKVL